MDAINEGEDLDDDDGRGVSYQKYSLVGRGRDGRGRNS